MKKENLRSCTRKYLQQGMASNESYDVFSALVGAGWALRRAKKSEREMVKAFERIAQLDAAIAVRETGEKSPATEVDGGEPDSTTTSSPFFPQRQGATTDRGGLLRYVVLYALTLVLQPVLTAVLTLAALWGLWQVLLWVFSS
jgi:hypothetical protein